MNVMQKLIGFLGVASALVLAPVAIAEEVQKGVLDEVNATRTKVVIDGVEYRLVSATRIGKTLSRDDEVAPLERDDLEPGGEVFYVPDDRAKEPTLKSIYLMIQ